jgi:hypothetical protein
LIERKLARLLDVIALVRATRGFFKEFSMNRVALVLAAIVTCVLSSATHAGVIPLPPPGPARVANAAAVVVGKVEALEPQEVKVGTTTYRIAVVKVRDAVRGLKQEKTLRVGFIPFEEPKGGVRISGARPVQLAVGQDGLFILARQAKHDFYTVGGVFGYYINSTKNDGFAQEVQAAKLAVKLMEDPQAALKAKDAEERLTAAAILIAKYRTYRGPKSRLEPIDAKLSKQIMQVLADADWKAPMNHASVRVHPMQLFQRLGVTATDGFRPAPGASYQAAAQAWVRENAGKYRIQRFAAPDVK